MPIPLRLAKLLIRTGIARRMPRVQQVTGGGADFLPYYSDSVLTAPNTELLATRGLLRKAQQLAAGESPGKLIDLSLGAPRFRRFEADDFEAALGAEAAGRRQQGAASRTSGGPLRPKRAWYLGYPPPFGLAELREAVAEKLQRENGITCCPEREVVVTGGVCHAITLAIDTFVNPGDKVVLLDPSFLMYYYCLRFQRARIEWVPAPSRDGELRVDLKMLSRALRGAKLLFLNTPSNPTGAVLSPYTLEAIARLAARRDVLLFSDEVYERFLYDGTFISTARLPGARRRTLTANSFSKSHGMAAYRVGYLAAHEHLMRPLQMNLLVRSPFVATLCQRLALRVLAEPVEAFQPVLEEFECRRRRVRSRLAEMGIECSLPRGAFYYWIPVHRWGMTGLQFAHRLLEDQQVLLMPGDDFGPSGERHVRLSYATDPQELDEGLDRLGTLLAGLDCPVRRPHFRINGSTKDDRRWAPRSNGTAAT